MDYLKEYRSFVNSHYLSSGFRMTIGILLPAFVAGYFNQIEIGINISIGALAVATTDNPGPILHRRNALIACAIITFFVSLITGLVSGSPLLFSLWLLGGCFLFSMIGVYGARITSVGLASILVIVLQSHEKLHGTDVIMRSIYLLTGSTWYILLSLLLYTLRPYRLVQQALGDYILAAADYLRIKASFYRKEVAYDESYDKLLQIQRDMQEKQNLVTELLFKTRNIVKESTHVGRVLMMLFLDTTEVFELAMTSHQDYHKLHSYFDETGVLEEYEHLILKLANELDKVGLAVKSGSRSNYRKQIDKQVAEERTHLNELRLQILNPQNLEGFISLRHILDSIEILAARVRTLHHYTSYDVKLRRKKFSSPSPETFVQHQTLDARLILDNFSFKANIFRHSLRLSLAALFAYVLINLLPLGKNVGHSYWVLLTIVVIIKPAFGLSRQRNVERLIGTVIGAIIGVLLIYLIQNETVKLVLLVLFALGTYSFIRHQYLFSVVLMTIYLLLMFHLLEPGDFNHILKDRVIDTAIGSGVAFLFSYLLPPVWEYETIDDYMREVLEKNIVYYQLIAETFTGKSIDKSTRNLARKQSWVALANLGDALNRMLNEPKWKQRNATLLHQFVVSNHMLTSHIATLAYYIETLKPEYVLKEYQPVIDASIRQLQQALTYIKNMGNGTEEPVPVSVVKEDKKTRALEEKINELLQQRRQEITLKQYDSSTRHIVSDLKAITDQFYFIKKIAADVEKVSSKVKG